MIKFRTLILFSLSLFISCQGNQEGFETNIIMDSIPSIRKVIEGEEERFYLGDYLVAVREKQIDKSGKAYYRFNKFFSIGKAQRKSLNETLVYYENGDIVEESSQFYSCFQIGEDLLISYCFNNVSDTAQIILNGGFDNNFLPPNQPCDTLIFCGTNFLVKNYKKYCVNDTFRAVLSPRDQFFINGKHEMFFVMMFVEYPNRFDFSNLE
jgi:hypothetical protein